jgi:hypothetical protein
MILKKFIVNKVIYRIFVFIVNLSIQVWIYILFWTLFQFSNLWFVSYFSDIWTLYVLLTIIFYKYWYLFLVLNVLCLIFLIILSYV